MQMATKTLADHRPSIGQANIQLGDNRFLAHATHEITVDGERVGDALVSLYDFRSANTMGVARSWLSQPNSYLAQYRKYLFRPEMMLATLPVETEVSGNGTGKVVILDELLLDPGYSFGGFDGEVLSKIIDSYKSVSEVILLPKWQSLGRRMGMKAEEQLHYFASLGFLAIDGAMMIRTSDIN